MIRSVLLFLCLVLSAEAVNAQPRGLTSDGTDFYLGLIPSSIHCFRDYVHTYALVTSYNDNKIIVNYFDASGNEIFGRYVQLQAKLSSQIDIDHFGNRLTPGGEVVEYKACHIVSSSPISVHYYSTGPASGAEYSVFPTHALGEHYIVASHPSNPGSGAGGTRYGCDGYYRDSASSVFMVVAAHDSTHVTIIPNGTTYRLHVQGVTTGRRVDGTQHPIHLTLERGQIYFVKSENDLDSFDESGSTIDADRPVAVIAGNEAAAADTIEAGSGGKTPPSRNLMLQQMIPSEYLVAKDHLSMPFVEFGLPHLPYNTSGQFYKMYTSSPSGATAVVQIDTMPPSTFVLTPFGLSPNVEFVTQGINISSVDESPIMVEESDYRRQEARGNTAPTMMNVLAKSQWVNHCAFMIPDDASQVRKSHFLNVISRSDQLGHILIAKDGAQPTSLSAMATFGLDAQWASHPELVGKRYALNPGSYYLTSDSNFAAYTFGYLCRDPDNNGGNNDDDDYYFEYASPVGEQFFANAPGSIAVTITKDSCNGWIILATEQDSANMGLASIELLNDSAGFYSTSAHISQNVTATKLDVSGKSDAQIAVQVINPLLKAYAAIRILSRTGRDTIIELRQGGLILSVPKFLFMHPVGIDTCGSFVVRNDTAQGQRSFTFNTLQLPSDSTVRITSTKPALPFTLRRGDSVRVNFCYRAVDTLQFADTVLLGSSCIHIPVPISGKAITPLIMAWDHGFYVIKDESECAGIEIRNMGSETLTIDTFSIQGSSTFSVPDTIGFPISILPGDMKRITVCYHPIAIGIDSAVIHLSTNLRGKFVHAIKDSTKLFGRAILSSVTTKNWVASDLRISPNPIRGNVLSLQGDLLQHQCTLGIYDLLGVRVKSISHLARGRLENLDVSQLAAGSYYLRVEAAGLIRTVKFIIER